MPSRILVLLVAAACLAVGASVSSEASGPRRVRIDGAAAQEQIGVQGALSVAGDVNGDGKADLVLAGGRFAYVVFGGPSLSSIDLASLGSDGFRIDAKGVGTIFAVAGAGDVNGDGLADMIVGVANAKTPGHRGSGAAFVIFGGPSKASVTLAKLGQRGFRLDGTNAGSDVGYSVAGAGDVNGDGLADVVIAAAQGGAKARSAGAAFVVFGKKSMSTVDLATLGDGGFRIDGAVENEEIDSVAGVGDVNEDGHADIVLGAPGLRNGGGAAYVIFGKSTPTSVDLAALGNQGFLIESSSDHQALGDTVAAAGDVNGDGRADVLVGTFASDRSYLIFGKSWPTTVRLAALGAQGATIRGANTVGAVADVNGDGRPDLVVGAPEAGNNGRQESGSAYVVLGNARPASVDVRSLGKRGVRIDGASGGDRAGWGVAAGDLNGDGLADVVVGAPDASNNNRETSGSVYVVFGTRKPGNVDLAIYDSKAPTLTLSAPTTQSVLGQRGVFVNAECDEPCSFTASGSVSLAGAVIPLGGASAATELGAEEALLKLPLSATTRKHLVSALGSGSAKVAVTVRATDRGGNQVVGRLTVVLRLDRKWCAPTWHTVVMSGVPQLSDVVALSPTNVWAVGSRGPYKARVPMITHWNGKRLGSTRAFVLSGPKRSGSLSGLAALSPTDIWAVGADGDRPVSLHWDGHRWQKATLPIQGTFADVVAVSHSDVWAVGQTGEHVLAAHWDGRSWRVTPIGHEGAFAAVDADRSGDVWAVGAQGLTGPSVNDIGSLAMRWNGRKWVEVPDPGNGGDEEGLNAFNAVDVVSRTKLWAMRAVSLASWDNGRWRGYATPHGLYAGIAAVGSNDVWAVGFDTNDAGPVVMHWNGHIASSPYTPFRHRREATLNGLSALSPKDLWAVGNGLVARDSCS